MTPEPIRINVPLSDVLNVAAAYAGRDSWGVEGIYLRTLSRLLADLAAGIPADLIAAHAHHVGPECCPLGRTPQ